MQAKPSVVTWQRIDAAQSAQAWADHYVPMRILTEKIIADFVARHTQMVAPLARWSKVIGAIECNSFNELKRVFPSVD